MTSPDVNLDEHIAGLRELTVMLRGTGEAAYGDPATGVWRGRGLCHRGEVAVLDCEADADVVLPPHAHNCAEVMTVYRGSIRVEVGGEVRIYGVGETVDLAPGVPHLVTTLEPSALIAVTVPAEENYPRPPGEEAAAHA